LPAGLVSSGPIAPDLPSDEAAGSNPVRYVSGRIMGQPQASISNTGAQAAPSSSQVGGLPVGIFSGQTMLPFPLPPSFWRRRDELRADFQHLRRWRKSVEQAQSFTFKAAITIIVTGFVGAVWLGVKVMLGK
jgi:hypothetical protein